MAHSPIKISYAIKPAFIALPPGVQPARFPALPFDTGIRILQSGHARKPIFIRALLYPHSDPTPSRSSEDRIQNRRHRIIKRSARVAKGIMEVFHCQFLITLRKMAAKEAKHMGRVRACQ
jgi:hypothetical protein